jgi:hypothetical protein
MELKDELRDWTDYDTATWILGNVLGVVPRQNYPESKYVFDTNNPVSTGMYNMLKMLVDIGVLEGRDEPDGQQFRWGVDYEEFPWGKRVYEPRPTAL